MVEDALEPMPEAIRPCKFVQLFPRLDQRLLEPRDLLRHVRGRDVVFRDDLLGHAVDIDLAAGHAR